ncbi:PAN domain-containing protein [Wenxinia marina]|uniref:PAN domain-containing protein n=1 Tax=Wenxinia marina TaxID=390641 RepID=UPI003465D166
MPGRQSVRRLYLQHLERLLLPQVGRRHPDGERRGGRGLSAGLRGVAGARHAEGLGQLRLARRGLFAPRRSRLTRCYLACEIDRRCRAFAFVRAGGACWLKDRVGQIVDRPGVELGVR